MMNNLASTIGKPKVFVIVFIISITWFIAGFFIEYEKWFDIMDFTVFMSTFFLLFIVQSSQNADTRAIQHKLDEIINSMPGADRQKEKEEMRIKRGDKE